MYRHVIWYYNIQNYHKILIYPHLLNNKLPLLFRVRNSLSPPQLQICSLWPNN